MGGLARRVRLIAVALGVLVPGAAAHAEPPATRIVSINLCTDQLLLELVPRERIAGLSHLAADRTLSATAARADGLATTHGQAEEVLELEPDLVLTVEYSTPAAVDMLRRLGKRVVVLPLASDLDGIRAAVRKLADALGERARGEAVIARFDERLAAAAPRSDVHPTALAYQINSLAAGPASLLDAAMTAAGFANQARSEPLGPAGRLPLELLVTRPPDLLVMANSPEEFRTVSADNLRHPAIRRVMATRPSVEVPMSLWLCGTPALAEAVERLASSRRALVAEGAAGKVTSK